MNTKSVEKFQDQIWALEQMQQAANVRLPEDVVDHEATAEVLTEMEHFVADNPEIVDFYSGALKKYKAGHPESVTEELEPIKERVEIMHAEGDLTGKRYAATQEKIATGEIVVDEAKVFFKMFKHVIPEDKMPKRTTVAPRKTRQRKQPNQARNIDVEITPHGGIRVNGTFLRALSDAQKLIILSGLAKNEGFRNSEIYRSDEFREIVGTNKTDEELKQTFNDEFTAMQTVLVENRASRLLDANRKPGERKHTIEAQTVTDLRTPQTIEKAAREVHSVPPIPFYERQTEQPVASETLDAPADTTEQAEFGAGFVARAHQMVINAIVEQGSVSRTDLVDHYMNEFHIDETKARKLVTAVYEFERNSQNRFFAQVKTDGPKRFEQLPEEDRQAVSPYGPYFDGTAEEFAAAYGALQNIASGQLNYESGKVIRLTDREQALLDYFKRPDKVAAQSEKQVVFELDQAGIPTTKQELRQTVSIINALTGREFIRSLPPASRMAGKGPRIQRVGSFVS